MLTIVLRGGGILVAMALHIVAARTSQVPIAKCGTNTSKSTRKDRRVRIVVIIIMMKMARRNRTECDGERTCAIIERMRATRVSAAAMTCTIRILDNPLRADGGREKLLLLFDGGGGPP
jgi:uncharacterized membrane protein